ncbi:MAG: hypothetical protein PHP23_10085 [Desulfobacterales bacterium]|nr:hypothetical protein [Desulfobacterales bacterium]MDD4072656.1 hypothetical protein [Desulfobacterales bacterium]MDD4391765.1 hypothetical protein [Desulfobacterales bacterium]
MDNKNFTHRFDFDIGYLVKSPCKGCANRGNFPACSDECVILDQIRTRLVGCVSSTKNYSSADDYALNNEG